MRLLLIPLLLTVGFAPRSAGQPAPKRPNVIIVCADDLGWGDTSCYGARALRTPNIDRLAREGLRFTDAHSAAATCTPSRYALLTGEYAFRKRGTGVLPGDAALIIEPGRPTLASIFRRAGYATAVVGKWHLGLGSTNLDWNGAIRPGPNNVGFDYSFIMAATADRVPCVYVRNDRVVNLDPLDPIRVSYRGPVGSDPTGRENPGLLRMRPSHGHDMTIVNGVSRIGYMSGGKSARWLDETMADTFTEEAVDFLERHRSAPFFLYFALHDPHVPRIPHPRFVGKSRLGPRGDAIVQADACVGRLMAALDRLGLARRTVVMLTSDNGAVVDDGYKDEAVERLGSHLPNGPWRGGKYSKFEGGTRVPLIVRWPGVVRPGVSGALVGQVDFIASMAGLLGTEIPGGSAGDSENHLAALLGRTTQGRSELVEHAGGLGLRAGNWKYIEPADAVAVDRNTNTELANSREPQLYDLANDPGERQNLARQLPERTATMAERLRAIRSRDGR